jgi:hypothetical protein
MLPPPPGFQQDPGPTHLHAQDLVLGLGQQVLCVTQGGAQLAVLLIQLVALALDPDQLLGDFIV